MNRKIWGVLLMTVAAVFFASSTLLMKWIPQVTQLHPGHLAVWRFLIAAPILTLVIILRNPSSSFLPKKPLRFFGCGVIYSIASLCAIFALERLPASIYIIIVYIYPALVVLFALFTGRTVPKAYWFGLPLSLIGLALTAYDFSGTLRVDWIGVLITILNAFAVASYMLVSERTLKGTDSSWIGTNGIFLGAMLVGLLMIPILGFSVPKSLESWALVIAFGVFGTLMPILMMNIGVQWIGAARVSIMNTLQPVLAVLFSIIVFNEKLTMQQWIGGAIVLVTVIMLQLSSDKKGKKSGVLEGA